MTSSVGIKSTTTWLKATHSTTKLRQHFSFNKIEITTFLVKIKTSYSLTLVTTTHHSDMIAI